MTARRAQLEPKVIALARALEGLGLPDDRIAYLGPAEVGSALEQRGVLPSARDVDPAAATLVIAVEPSPERVHQLLADAPAFARIVLVGEIGSPLAEVDLYATVHRKNLELRRIPFA